MAVATWVVTVRVHMFNVWLSCSRNVVKPFSTVRKQVGVSASPRLLVSLVKGSPVRLAWGQTRSLVAATLLG